MERSKQALGTRKSARPDPYLKRYEATRPVEIDIEVRLRPIRDLFALLAEADTPEGYEDAVYLVKTAAQRWAAALVPDRRTGEVIDEPTANVAAQSLMRLIMTADALGQIMAGKPVRNVDQSTFWKSRLGQLIFRNNGFPKRAATLHETAAILGISRQGVSYLIRRPETSKLEAVPGSSTEITRRSLYAEWAVREARRAAEKAEPKGGTDKYADDLE
jgi:hypothetical protein